MAVVVAEVWVKVYVVEVKMEVGWMDDVSVGNPILSARQHSTVRLVSFPRRRLKEVQSMGYIQGLISLDL